MRPGAAIPPVKALVSRYGVCSATVRKALDACTRSGALIAERRGWRVPQPRVPARGSSVVLMAAGYPTGNLAFTNPRSREHYRALEGECVHDEGQE